MYAGDVRLTVSDGAVHQFRGVWISKDSLGDTRARVDRGFPVTPLNSPPASPRSGTCRASR
jgi:hypothetical protein